MNALAASDSVLIPVNPQLWSATGLTQLLRIIVKVKKRINPCISIEGILMTMCNFQANLYEETFRLVEVYYRETFVSLIYKSRCPSKWAKPISTARALYCLNLIPR
ncbi:ParA family protein [Paenibacillus sinensis]|uniref:ParA family protein n=1 Tax=Paenibacillus TaxID=44249 RepID=UPI00389928A2